MIGRIAQNTALLNVPCLSSNDKCFHIFYLKQRVNCRGRHCNFKDGGATIESCQKCSDLERCHKITVRFLSLLSVPHRWLLNLVTV